MRKPISFIVCLALILSIIFPQSAVSVYASSIAIKADSFSSSNVSNDGTKLLWTTGHAITTNGAARLVSSANWQAGTMVKSGRIQITNGFSTYFELKIHNPQSSGYADGISFLFYESKQPLVGISGGGLGYKGIASSAAVEFDIWQNGEFSDPSKCHIAIMQNGNSSHVTNQPRIDYPELEGSVIRVWVDYDGSTLTATVGTSSAITKGSIGNRSISQSGLSYLNNKDVYIGFSAATGGTGADHDVLKWYFQDQYQSEGLVPYAADGQPFGNYSQAAATVGITLDQVINPSKASITLNDSTGVPLTNQAFTLELDGTSLGTVDGSGNPYNTSNSGVYDYSIPADMNNGTHSIKATAPGGATNSLNFTVEKYKIFYYGNGASGTTATTPVMTSFHPSGSSVTVAGQGTITRGAYTFDGWNTKADGTGISYSAGIGQVLMTSNVSLYAQWKALAASPGTAQACQSGTPVVVDPSISVIDRTATFEKATVMIRNVKAGDQLTFSAISGITGSYNSGTGVLSLSGSTTGATYESLLRSVKFSTTSSDQEPRIVSFSLGSSLYNEENGHYYEYVSASLSWTDSYTQAASRTFNYMQGYLATITNTTENAFITKKLGADAWIGASDDPTYTGDANPEGRWYWVTGPEYRTLFSVGNTNPVVQSGKYMNWNGSEPNDSGSNEDYGEIYSSTGTGKWNDLPNTSKLGYVVEYGGMPNDTPVILQASRSVAVIALPGAPTNVTAVAGDKQATVSFSAPASNGGSTITEYQVTASPGNMTATGSSTTITIGGLTNGQTYTFSVKAKNAAGYGAAGSSSSVGLPSTVSFQSNGGTAVASITNVAIGAKITQPAAPTKAGFTFGQWYKEPTLTTPWAFSVDTVTGDAILYAGWNANTNTTYQVDHYQQDLNGSGYTMVSGDTQNLTGTTGAIVTAIPWTYTGFGENTSHTSRVAIGTIAADGSLVLKLYYDRTTHTVEFNSNGGSAVTSATGIRYGSTIAAVTAPALAGYTFDQWYKNAALTTPWAFAIDTVTGDAILYAGWTKIPRSSGNAAPAPLPPITNTASGPQIQPTVSQTTLTIGGEPTNVIQPNESQIIQALNQQLTQQPAQQQGQQPGQQPAPGPNILINAPNSLQNSIVALSGDTISKMQQQDANLVVQSGTTQFKLPADSVDLNSAAAQLGQNTPPSQISVGIQIAQPSAETKTSLARAAESKGFQILAEPVEFHVIAMTKDRSTEITEFASALTSNILIPPGIDPNSVTTAVELAPNGALYHVPTKIVNLDGKYYAQITSLMAGTCTLITNQTQFADTKNHWAQSVIDDMASRMVVAGYGNSTYQPEKEMTRAEFSAILVKATGLPPGIGDNLFQDIESYRWYLGYVETAQNYGLINGIDATNFGAKNEITRQQAMTMLARTMELTGLEVTLTSGELEQTLNQYRDGSTASVYARESIVKLLKAGIISGRSDQTLALRDTVTRAEVAVMMKNLLTKSGLI